MTNTADGPDLEAEYGRAPVYRRAWFCAAVLLGGLLISPLLAGLAAVAILWSLTRYTRQRLVVGPVSQVIPVLVNGDSLG